VSRIILSEYSCKISLIWEGATNNLENITHLTLLHLVFLYFDQQPKRSEERGIWRTLSKVIVFTWWPPSLVSSFFAIRCLLIRKASGLVEAEWGNGCLTWVSLYNTMQLDIGFNMPCALPCCNSLGMDGERRKIRNVTFSIICEVNVCIRCFRQARMHLWTSSKVALRTKTWEKVRGLALFLLLQVLQWFEEQRQVCDGRVSRSSRAF